MFHQKISSLGSKRRRVALFPLSYRQMGQCKLGELCILEKAILYLRTLPQVGIVWDSRFKLADFSLSQIGTIEIRNLQSEI